MANGYNKTLGQSLRERITPKGICVICIVQGLTYHNNTIFRGGKQSYLLGAKEFYVCSAVRAEQTRAAH